MLTISSQKWISHYNLAYYKFFINHICISLQVSTLTQ